jgi:hypothetical protein
MLAHSARRTSFPKRAGVASLLSRSAASRGALRASACPSLRLRTRGTCGRSRSRAQGERRKRAPRRALRKRSVTADIANRDSVNCRLPTETLPYGALVRAPPRVGRHEFTWPAPQEWRLLRPTYAVADRADGRASALLASTHHLFLATCALTASPKPLSPLFLPAGTAAYIQSAASGSVRDTERAAPTRRCSRHCGRTSPGASAPLSTLTRRRHVSCRSLLLDTPLVAQLPRRVAASRTRAACG